MGAFDMNKELREKIADSRAVPVQPGDADFDVILEVDTRNKLVVFASHDRRGRVAIPWEVVWEVVKTPLAAMTASQRAQAEKEIQAAAELYPNSRSSVAIRPVPHHFSPQLQRQIERGQSSIPPIEDEEPEPVSETDESAADSDIVAKLKAQAKNSLEVWKEIGATPDVALGIILSEVIAAENPRRVAGEWITKFTNGITDLLNEIDPVD